MLATYNLAACAKDEKPASGTTTTSTTSAPGGTFEVPDPADVEACDQTLQTQGEFIFDVHTHHVVPDGPWRHEAARIATMIRGLVPSGCTDTDPYRCLDRTAYLHDMFLASDTTMTLLSDVPNTGPEDAPLPWAEKRESRRLAGALAHGGAPRVLIHDVIAPNFGPLDRRLAAMEKTVATGEVTAFKVYTAWGPSGQGFSLADPAIGIPVVEQARRLGVRTICAHKGLPLLEFDRSHNGPDDLVRVASQYPDMNFVVYHGAYEIQTTEGPYDANRAATGINSLVRAMDDHHVEPNTNVYAELGTTWRETLGDPTQAAHVLGKLLTRVGEDNVMWGTDAIWYGSPQPQLMAFRAFQIAPELQERFGYPALTPMLKAKILGGNAARLFRVDPEAARCALDDGELTEARGRLASLHADGLVDPWQPRGPLSRREVFTWLRNLRHPWTP